MSLAEGFGSSSASDSAALGELLAFFGAVADFAAGLPPDRGERVAGLASAIAGVEDLSAETGSALYFAARLRNIGILGNAAFAKANTLSERAVTMAKWDIPADGARICEQIAALPHATADIVRWQAECWDGTGYPDQLRWTGIPKAAQILHIAETFAAGEDPEEAFMLVSSEAGRTFSPEQTRSFIMWFHLNEGQIAPVPAPHAALARERTQPDTLLAMLARRIDAHNGTPDRSKRTGEVALEIGRTLGYEQAELRRIMLASQLFGIGELQAATLEEERFDALARLGIEVRSEHAQLAAEIIASCACLADIAPIVRARAEWFDGTGEPAGLRNTEIRPPHSR